MTGLHSLKPAAGSRKKRKRIGRGESSGWGKTAGRGHKGQNARSGGGMPPWFEGGQMPLTRRVPKRGFKNTNRIEFVVVNIRDLETMQADPITPETLKQAGRIKGRDVKVKILGNGDISKAVHVKAHAFSRSALAKITAAGGTAEVVGT